MCSDHAGYVHVVWNDGRDGDREIYYKRSTDCGVTWDDDKRLTFTSSTPRSMSICSDFLGILHLVWTENRVGNGEIYYKRSLDGGATWDDDVRLTYDNGISGSPAICADDLANIHLVWKGDTENKINYKRSSDQGTSWGGDKVIVQSNYPYLPEICSDEKNRIHVVWVDTRHGYTEIFYIRSLDSGGTWETEIRLTDAVYDSHYPAIVSSQNNVNVVWQDHRDGFWEIYYKKSPDGGRSWKEDERLTFDDAKSYQPSIASDDLSRLHIVWRDFRDDNWEIYYKKGKKRDQKY